MFNASSSSGGSGPGGAETLQDAYDASTDGKITLDATRNGFWIADKAAGIGEELLKITSASLGAPGSTGIPMIRIEGTYSGGATSADSWYGHESVINLAPTGDITHGDATAPFVSKIFASGGFTCGNVTGVTADIDSSGASTNVTSAIGFDATITESSSGVTGGSTAYRCTSLDSTNGRVKGFELVGATGGLEAYGTLIKTLTAGGSKECFGHSADDLSSTSGAVYGYHMGPNTSTSGAVYSYHSSHATAELKHAGPLNIDNTLDLDYSNTALTTGPSFPGAADIAFTAGSAGNIDDVFAIGGTMTSAWSTNTNIGVSSLASAGLMGSYSNSIHGGTGTLHTTIGSYGLCVNNAGTTTQAAAHYASIQNQNVGTITVATMFSGDIQVLAGTITDAYVMRIQDNMVGGTSKHGIHILQDVDNHFEGETVFNTEICTTQEVDSSTTGTVNALAPTTSFLRMSAATTLTLNGIVAGTDGQHLWLINDTGNAITINHNSGSAASGNEILTNTGGAVVSTANSRHHFMYCASDSKWILMASAL